MTLNLLKMKEEKTIKIVEVSHPIFDDIGGKYIMPWGKYKGVKIENIPFDYLKWCLANTLDLNVRHNVKLFFQQRQKFIS